MGKILVVDDEKSIRLTFSHFLRQHGYQVDSAPNAEEALMMMDEKKYDVVLTDIIMPRMSGMEMLAKIRMGCPHVQIIVMTGEPTVETAVKAVRSGANDYLQKPINKEKLIKTVEKSYQIKALNDEKIKLEEQNQLYQKNLEKIVETKTHALQQAMQSIIVLLSTAVEIRDPYTAGHQRRVGNLSAAIAQKMDLGSKTVDFLRIIGYIHDIGKMHIPTDILVKPGKLSFLEMEMIRNHALYGYEMLKKVDLPHLIAETVYQHHERCDGSGYPRGLKGNQINLEAHIIMVADVVEAMMSHRPYRPALGLQAALQEIKNNEGRLYDPKVVAACVALFEKDKYTIEDTEHKIYFPL